MADGNGYIKFDAKVFAARKKLLDIRHVPLSKDAPYKIFLKRNGKHLKDCLTSGEVETYVMNLPEETFAKPIVTQRNSTAKR